jgi:hypothetical protein
MYFTRSILIQFGMLKEAGLDAQLFLSEWNNRTIKGSVRQSSKNRILGHRIWERSRDRSIGKLSRAP